MLDHQYRSEIFYNTDEEKEIAEKSFKRNKQKTRWKSGYKNIKRKKLL